MAAPRGKISDVMLDCLYLDEGRIGSDGKRDQKWLLLPDPIGEVLEIDKSA